jgi:hypothetical protein
MKLTKIFSAIIALTALFLTSCDKDVETSKVVLEKCDSAKIRVNVYADFNLKTAGVETVKNAIILASIPNSDFNNSTAKGEWQKYFVADDNGFVTIAVPADNDGVTVTLKLTDIKLKEVQADNVTDTISKTYTASTSVSVKPREIAYVNMTGTTETTYPSTTLITVTGYIVGDVDTTNYYSGSLDYVTNPITLKFYTDNWSALATTVQKTGTNINGDTRTYTEFTVSVPKNATISYDYNSTLTKIISKVGHIKDWKQDYIYKGTSSFGPFTETTVNTNKVINIGSGSTPVIFLN